MASMRVFVKRIIQNSKQIFENTFSRQPPKGKDVGRFEIRNENLEGRNFNRQNTQRNAPHNFGISRFYQYHKHVSNSLGSELRRQAALRFPNLLNRRLSLGLKTFPLQAFVSVGLVAGSINIQEEDRFDAVCEYMKAIFKENFDTNNDRSSASVDTKEVRVKDFEFGPLLDKGCNAAVFSAKCHQQNNIEVGDAQETIPSETLSESDSDIVILSQEDEISTDGETSMSWSALEEEFDESDISIISETVLNSFESQNLDQESNETKEPRHEEALEFDLAVKVMFNYDTDSNATAIFNAMASEAVPALQELQEAGEKWENGNHVKKKRLKPHPNIVEMWGTFVDEMPNFPEAKTEFPHALPERLYQDGCGRNQTMFLVMKRYDSTLEDYLKKNCLTTEESLSLLSQLVEALAWLNQEGIAHRDIKSNNILIEETEKGAHLVLSDFGCCLADEDLKLRIPYICSDMSKGGNSLLMAPEILNARPDPWGRSFLDYSKSDIWAAGALAYEIFGFCNPFYKNSDGKQLHPGTYNTNKLPEMPGVPAHIERIVKMMLHKDPSKRPSALEVSNMLSILQWCPSDWTQRLSTGGQAPKRHQVMRWIQLLGARAILKRLSVRSQDCECYQNVPLTSLNLFLSTLCFDDIMSAVQKLWTN